MQQCARRAWNTVILWGRRAGSGHILLDGEQEHQGGKMKTVTTPFRGVGYHVDFPLR